MNSIGIIPLCVLAPLILGVSAQSEVRRQIDSGDVCGLIREAEEGVKYASFRGIPYAKPPVGELRFAEPQPPTPWEGCLDASVEGPSCPQYDEQYGRLVDPQKPMSEACLYANVHVPLNLTSDGADTSSGLPIFVFIHGGGFEGGSGDTDLHGPEYMVRKNFIVITFNYRLNVFGFLSLGTCQIPGNAGLRDILALLRWVQRNAAAFGGNPDNITLGGQSVGSTLVHLITLSTPAQGMIKRAIMMSGTAIPSFYSPSRTYADLVSSQFLALLGINSTDTDYIYNQLIHRPLEDIMNANRIMQYRTGAVTFVAVIETEDCPGVTKMLDDDPVTLIKSGRGKDIPLIVGFSKQEAQFFKRRFIYLNIIETFMENPPLLLSASITYSVSDQVGDALARQVMRRYFNGPMTVDEYIVLCTDTYFIYPAFKLAEWRADMNALTYLYEFSFDSTFNVVKDGLMLNYEGGGCHVEDLTNIFRTTAMQENRKAFPPRSRDDLMKYWMTEFVANFINCSKPFCEDTSSWPSSKSSALNYQSLYDPMHIDTNIPATREQRDMIRFFDNIELQARRSLEYSGNRRRH